MASCRAKTIEEIDELSEMFEAMKALDISFKGLKTLDEMKVRVKEELNAPGDSPSWTAGQVRNNSPEMLLKIPRSNRIGFDFSSDANGKTVQKALRTMTATEIEQFAILHSLIRKQ